MERINWLLAKYNQSTHSFEHTISETMNTYTDVRKYISIQ